MLMPVLVLVLVLVLDLMMLKHRHLGDTQSCFDFLALVDMENLLVLSNKSISPSIQCHANLI